MRATKKDADAGIKWRDHLKSRREGLVLSKAVAVPTTKSEIGHLTTGQRWKFRRNLVIFISSQNGASQRLLGDVFDLPHSRIAAIVKEFRSKYGDLPCET